MANVYWGLKLFIWPSFFLGCFKDLVKQELTHFWLLADLTAGIKMFYMVISLRVKGRFETFIIMTDTIVIVIMLSFLKWFNSCLKWIGLGDPSPISFVKQNTKVTLRWNFFIKKQIKMSLKKDPRTLTLRLTIHFNQKYIWHTNYKNLLQPGIIVLL